MNATSIYTHTGAYGMAAALASAESLADALRLFNRAGTNVTGEYGDSLTASPEPVRVLAYSGEGTVWDYTTRALRLVLASVMHELLASEYLTLAGWTPDTVIDRVISDLWDGESVARITRILTADIREEMVYAIENAL